MNPYVSLNAKDAGDKEGGLAKSGPLVFKQAA